MGYNSNIYKQAADRLRLRRQKAERDADRRREEIYNKLPKTKELEKKISACGIQAAKAVLAGGDVNAKMQELRVENLALQQELKELLTSNGYSENAFEPSFHCEKCGDTGYYEDGNRTVVCDCLKQELVACACDELNRTAPLSLCTFESFDLGWYDNEVIRDGISPRGHMEKVLKFCKAYAERFPDDKRSILMKGSTGLGKTHLSLAIANEVIKKGFGVIYTSAPSLMQELENSYYTREGSPAELLADCDLLIIDDLGTEYKRYASSAQLYNIINSRLLTRKPVIINTNLSLKELEDNYTDRFVSRIVGDAVKLDFIGKDIRVRKK